MDDFSYHRPKDVEEAISLYQSADDPMYLSGGMTLIPTTVSYTHLRAHET